MSGRACKAPGLCANSIHALDNSIASFFILDQKDTNQSSPRDKITHISSTTVWPGEVVLLKEMHTLYTNPTVSMEHSQPDLVLTSWRKDMNIQTHTVTLASERTEKGWIKAHMGPGWWAYSIPHPLVALRLNHFLHCFKIHQNSNDGFGPISN